MRKLAHVCLLARHAREGWRSEVSRVMGYAASSFFSNTVGAAILDLAGGERMQVRRLSYTMFAIVRNVLSGE